MKASYKIALAAAVALFVLAVILMPGNDPTATAEPAGDNAQADATPDERPTLRSDTPGDGSVQSMLGRPAAPTTSDKPKSLADAARDRIRAAQRPADAGQADASASKQQVSKPNNLNIGNNTTGPIALARTQAEPVKPAPKPETKAKPAVDQNALSAILGSSKNITTTASPRSETTALTAPGNASRSASSPESTPAKTYTIQPGDTFSKIADKVYGDEGRWVDIAQANSLVDPTRLKVGQVLKLPGEQPQLSAEEPSPPGPSGIKTYTIRAGDSLSTVAQKYYDDPTLWRIIYNFNRDKIGDNPNAIQAGMTVKVPPQLTGAR